MRISASSYSNTAPLVWSFLYGKNRGKVEIILDTAPARSAELLAQDRVDAALVPVIAFQMIDNVRLIPDVCVGARERVRSVCLVTKGGDLTDVRSVALDTSSRTSIVLTKIIFREFLGFEPEWKNAEPNLDAMLADADCALLIGDPALALSSPPAGGGVAAGSGQKDWPVRNAAADGVVGAGLRSAESNPKSKIQNPKSYDLAELWHKHTGLGFVFAMWMTRRESVAIDFAAARDEGLERLDEIIANYETDIGIGRDELTTYLSRNISYSIDDSMRRGMELYFELAAKNGLIDKNRPMQFARS